MTQCTLVHAIQCSLHRVTPLVVCAVRFDVVTIFMNHPFGTCRFITARVYVRRLFYVGVFIFFGSRVCMLRETHLAHSIVFIIAKSRNSVDTIIEV